MANQLDERTAEWWARVWAEAVDDAAKHWINYVQVRAEHNAVACLPIGMEQWTEAIMAEVNRMILAEGDPAAFRHAALRTVVVAVAAASALGRINLDAIANLESRN